MLLTGAIVTVCNELYPLYKKWLLMRTVGESQGIINISDNIVQVHMSLKSTKIVTGNQFARGAFYRLLTGAIVTVCNELYPLYKKWLLMRTVGESQGIINIID